MYFREKNIFFLETFIGGFLLNIRLTLKNFHKKTSLTGGKNTNDEKKII